MDIKSCVLNNYRGALFSWLFAVGYYRPFTAGEAEHLQENLK